MLDQMGGGRLQVGIGRGVSPIEMGFFGVEPRKARAILRRVSRSFSPGWSSRKSLTHHGTYFDYDDVPISGAVSSTSTDLVSDERRRVRAVGSRAASTRSSSSHRSTLRIWSSSIRTAWRQMRNFADHKVGMLRYVFVAETDAEAMKLAEPTYRVHLANLHLGQMRVDQYVRRYPTRSALATETLQRSLTRCVRLGRCRLASTSLSSRLPQWRRRPAVTTSSSTRSLATPLTDRGIACISLFADQVMPALQG